MPPINMNWVKVVRSLQGEGAMLRYNSVAAFPNDHVSRREMQGRAAILEALARALVEGMKE